MNNVKTRFVIAISQRLASAPESDAKLDLIEELSENLYSRYTDMVAGGMPEQEAYAAALDDLGDVNELLAYLDLDSHAAQAAGAAQGGTAPQGGPSAADMTPDDWFQNIGNFVQQTVNQAREAASDAAAMVRDAAGQLRSAEGMRINVNGKSFKLGNDRVLLRTDDEQELSFPSSSLKRISVNIVGDLTLLLDGDPDAPVRLEGDIEDLQVNVDQEGALSVTQGKSASGSFLFARALSSPSVQLTIPQRRWESLQLSTVSGDVECCDGVLKAEQIKLNTTSGDIQLDSLSGVRRLEVNTANGDLTLTDCTCDEVLFHSASGDLDAQNLTAAVLVQTASGDVTLSGCIRALGVSSASGDVELLDQCFPETLELNTKSGDLSVRIPENQGFILNYATVSGSLYSDFTLTTDANTRQSRGGRSGRAYYQDGGDGRIFSISSVSGDLELRRD